MASASLSLLAVLVAGALLALLADQAAGQTFSYSRGWKSGKRAGAQPAPIGPPPSGARTGDDVLADDMPLFRYFLEGRGEHRVSTRESSWHSGTRWPIGDTTKVKLCRFQACIPSGMSPRLKMNHGVISGA